MYAEILETYITPCVIGVLLIHAYDKRDKGISTIWIPLLFHKLYMDSVQEHIIRACKGLFSRNFSLPKNYLAARVHEIPLLARDGVYRPVPCLQGRKSRKNKLVSLSNWIWHISPHSTKFPNFGDNFDDGYFTSHHTGVAQKTRASFWKIQFFRNETRAIVHAFVPMRYVTQYWFVDLKHSYIYYYTNGNFFKKRTRFWTLDMDKVRSLFSNEFLDYLKVMVSAVVNSKCWWTYWLFEWFLRIFTSKKLLKMNNIILHLLFLD